MENWVLPFLITITYTVAAVILGYRARSGLDMSKMKNWGVTGNTMGMLVMFFLVGAGQVSAFTFMGAPGWAFSRGVAALYVVVYLVLMNFTLYLVNPRINELSTKHGILTQAEAFGRRYDSTSVRAISVVVGSLALIAYAVVQIVGCGYVINIMSGGNIPTWLGETIILIAIFSYVFRSGLRAIGWTNVMQGILMFIIAFTVGLTLAYKFTDSLWVGNVFETILNSDKAAALTLPGMQNNYSTVLWSTSIIVSVVSIWPSFWIMASGAKDMNSARKSITLLPLYQLVMLPMILVGFICIFAVQNYTGAPDKVALSLALDVLPWWMVGILGAGTLAAAQSSCEPLFQTLAFTWTRDFIGPLFKLDEDKQGKIQRWLLLPFMFGIVLPLSIMNPAQLVSILLIGYGFLAQIFPLSLGIWVWPRSTAWGAMIGMFIGVAVTAYFTWVMPNFLSVHAGVWGLLVNIPAHVIISLLTKPSKKSTIKTFFPDHIIEKLYVR
jgi:SSS family solute:Na+ symporter